VTKPSETEYDRLAGRLIDAGHPLAEIEAALSGLNITLPTWGFGDSGTRFAVFPQPGRPRDVFERIEDAAQINALTRSAATVALHLPWDHVHDLERLKSCLEARGLSASSINPNLFQDPDYRLGSLTNPSPSVRKKALSHLLQCVQVAEALGSPAQSLWLADGINYAGQDDLAERRSRMKEGLTRLYSEMPPDQSLLLEYKPFEPSFYAADIADWGSAVLLCAHLGDRAKVLVDLGHHLHGTNIEQIAVVLAGEGRLGGLHLNARKYADDDLIVGSTNPFELFLLFATLRATVPSLPPLTLDQAHNVEAKLEAILLSVMNLQIAYAKSLLVDLAVLRDAQESGDVVSAHRVLLDAFETDVRPLCAKVRMERGAEADPIAALRGSRYLEQKVSERR